MEQATPATPIFRDLRFKAQYKGHVIGWYDTLDEAQRAIVRAKRQERKRNAAHTLVAGLVWLSYSSCGPDGVGELLGKLPEARAKEAKIVSVVSDGCATMAMKMTGHANIDNSQYFTVFFRAPEDNVAADGSVIDLGR